MSVRSRFIAATALFALLLVTPTIILAQGEASPEAETTRGTVEVNRTDVRARLKELRESRTLTQTERTQEISELRQMRVAERCAIVTRNIQARLDFYKDNHSKHSSHYNRLITNVQNALDRLEVLELDTSELQDILDELEVLVADLRKANANMIDLLEKIEAAACNFEPGQEKEPESLTQFQEGLVEVREIVAEIKAKITEELIPTFRELKGTINGSTN